MKEVREDSFFSNRLISLINSYNNFQQIHNIMNIQELKDKKSELRLFVFYNSDNLQASILLFDLFHLVFPVQENNQHTNKIEKMKMKYKKRKNRTGDILTYFE